jgi:CheY-like chemotaxis protein
MKRLRILLVEDDANISALIAEVLSGMGHEACSTATTEQEAVAAAERLAPDVMIVDVALRAGGGLGAMATILGRTPMPHVFMTGGSCKDLPEDAIVLHKPFGLADLVKALDSVAQQLGPEAGGSVQRPS